MGDISDDPYADAKFTAEISTRMRVPDRIMFNSSGSNSPGHNNAAPTNGDKVNDLGMKQRDPRLDMMVIVGTFSVVR